MPSSLYRLEGVRVSCLIMVAMVSLIGGGAPAKDSAQGGRRCGGVRVVWLVVVPSVLQRGFSLSPGFCVFVCQFLFARKGEERGRRAPEGFFVAPDFPAVSSGDRSHPYFLS